MKTAISLPDFIYHQVTERAVVLGISRSEFFAKAAERYLAELDGTTLTDRINNAVDSAGHAGDDSNSIAVAAGRRVLDDENDEW